MKPQVLKILKDYLSKEGLGINKFSFKNKSFCYSFAFLKPKKLFLTSDLLWWEWYDDVFTISTIWQIWDD